MYSEWYGPRLDWSGTYQIGLYRGERVKSSWPTCAVTFSWSGDCVPL